MHKEIALQNALRYYIALLSSARFSEFDSEKSLPVDAFSKKIFRHAESFRTDQNLWWAFVPCSPPLQ